LLFGKFFLRSSMYFIALSGLEEANPAARMSGRFSPIGSAPYALSAINDALAAAESMTVTKALVDPWM